MQEGVSPLEEVFMEIFYYLLFISVAFFVLGFILGFLFLIQKYIEEKNEPIPKNPKIENSTECNEEKKEALEEALSKREKSNSCSFKNRVVDMEAPWDENLGPKEDFLLEHRSKQDDAYNYIASTKESKPKEMVAQ